MKLVNCILRQVSVCVSLGHIFNAINLTQTEYISHCRYAMQSNTRPKKAETFWSRKLLINWIQWSCRRRANGLRVRTSLVLMFLSSPCFNENFSMQQSKELNRKGKARRKAFWSQKKSFMFHDSFSIKTRSFAHEISLLFNFHTISLL